MVILSGIIPYRLPFLIEPVQIRFVIWDPFLDRLPRWLDGLYGFDVEGRRRWAGKTNNAFPEAVEAEEEFDFLTPEDGADGFHGALAAGALEGVAAPHLEDEIAPEWPHIAGPALGRGGNEKHLYRAQGMGDWLGLMRVANPRSMVRAHSTGFIGVDAVVADGLLAFGREVVDGGGDEVGGFKDLEVALGSVVAFRSVDDGLAAGIPGDFLEGEGMAE